MPAFTHATSGIRITASDDLAARLGNEWLPDEPTAPVEPVVEPVEPVEPEGQDAKLARRARTKPSTTE